MLIRATCAAASWRRITSIIGRSESGISGFGRTVVYGSRRVPRPPAITTACISARVHARLEVRAFHLDPIDHVLQAVAERRARLPPDRFLDLPRRPQEPQHLAPRGPYALVVANDMQGPVEQLSGEVHDLFH